MEAAGPKVRDERQSDLPQGRPSPHRRPYPGQCKHCIVLLHPYEPVSVSVSHPLAFSLPASNMKEIVGVPCSLTSKRGPSNGGCVHSRCHSEVSLRCVVVAEARGRHGRRPVPVYDLPLATQKRVSISCTNATRRSNASSISVGVLQVLILTLHQHKAAMGNLP